MMKMGKKVKRDECVGQFTDDQFGDGSRIYADTSVFARCDHRSFGVASRRIVNRFRSGAAILLSELTEQEVSAASPAAFQTRSELPDQNVERIIESEATRRLASAYIQSGALLPLRASDARHAALAAFFTADTIASRNFEIMTHAPTMQAINEVNQRCGHADIDIRPPWAIERIPSDGEGFDCVAFMRDQRETARS